MSSPENNLVHFFIDPLLLQSFHFGIIESKNIKHKKKNYSVNRSKRELGKIWDLIRGGRQKWLGYPFLHKAFKKNHGYLFDLKNPITHNQRIVHKMIIDRNPLMVITADRVKVRDYVLKILGPEEGRKILIPLYFISKTGQDIPHQSWDFEFFMKANHSSGDNMLIQPGEDPEKLKTLCKKWLRTSYGQPFHEWAYRDIPRRITCEKVLRDGNGLIPMDLKFYCFHGRVKMIYFLKDRFGDQTSLILDENLKEIPGSQMLGGKKMDTVPVFSNFEKMIEISERLSKALDFCRVDLYDVDGNIYFGEITHYSAAGTHRFDDFDTDLAYGEMWKEENKNQNFFQIYDEIKSRSENRVI